MSIMRFMIKLGTIELILLNYVYNDHFLYGTGAGKRKEQTCD